MNMFAHTPQGTEAESMHRNGNNDTNPLSAGQIFSKLCTDIVSRLEDLQTGCLDLAEEDRSEESLPMEIGNNPERILEYLYNKHIKTHAESEGASQLSQSDGDNSRGEGGHSHSSLREPGTSDRVWEQLQIDLKIQAQHLARHEAHVAKVESELQKIQCDINLNTRGETFKATLERYSSSLREKQSQLRKRSQNRQITEGLIRHTGCCPNDYNWVKVADGYMCEGGEHSISGDQVAGLHTAHDLAGCGANENAMTSSVSMVHGFTDNMDG